MRFNLKKQPANLASQFRAVQISDLEAHKLLPATVYLYLEANEKFLALKEPFDFFTEAELEKFSKRGTFHVPEHFDLAIPFREAGQSVRSMFEWSGGEGNELEPSSYEMSDAIIRQMANLWAPLDPTQKNNAGIESYFIAIFVHEIVDPLPSNWLDESRAKDLDGYLVSVLRAALSVFVALHLGFSDRKRLCDLYAWVFVESSGIVVSEDFNVTPQMKEIYSWTKEFIRSPGVEFLETDSITGKKGRVIEQLSSRLKRICSELISDQSRLRSIHLEPWVIQQKETEVRDAA